MLTRTIYEKIEMNMTETITKVSDKKRKFEQTKSITKVSASMYLIKIIIRALDLKIVLKHIWLVSVTFVSTLRINAETAEVVAMQMTVTKHIWLVTTILLNIENVVAKIDTEVVW